MRKSSLLNIILISFCVLWYHLIIGSFTGENVFAQQNFFIIGIYGHGYVVDGHKLAKDHGFNTLIVPPDVKTIKNTEKMGMKIIVKFNLFRQTVQDPKAFNNYLNKVVETIEHLKDNKNIIAWYVADEPDGLSIPINKFHEIYEKIKSIDPSPRVFAVFNSPKRWKSYLPYVDIVGIDPYLRRTEKGWLMGNAEYEQPDVVKRWIKQIKKDMSVLQIKKSLWVVLQAFEYKYEDPTIISPYKAITVNDMDMMLKLALDEDTQGIIFYTMGFPPGINTQTKKPYKAWFLPSDRPDLWEYLKGIDKRIESYRNSKGSKGNEDIQK